MCVPVCVFVVCMCFCPVCVKVSWFAIVCICVSLCLRIVARLKVCDRVLECVHWPMCVLLCVNL